MVAMRTALSKAGLKSSEERLREIGREAVRTAGQNFVAAVDNFHDALRGDADLCWYLLQRDRADVARPYLAMPAPAPQTIPARDRRTSVAVLVSETAKAARSVLDTFLINGTPIGKVTVEEARAWSSARKRDARFVELMIHGLPPRAVIGEYRKPTEATKLWEDAKNA